MNTDDMRKGFWYWVVCLGVPGSAGVLWLWTMLMLRKSIDPFQNGFGPAIWGMFFGLVVGLIRIPGKMTVMSAMAILIQLVVIICGGTLVMAMSRMVFHLIQFAGIALIFVALVLSILYWLSLLVFYWMRKHMINTNGKVLSFVVGCAVTELVAVALPLGIAIYFHSDSPSPLTEVAASQFHNCLESGPDITLFYTLGIAIVWWFRFLGKYSINPQRQQTAEKPTIILVAAIFLVLSQPMAAGAYWGELPLGYFSSWFNNDHRRITERMFPVIQACDPDQRYTELWNTYKVKIIEGTEDLDKVDMASPSKLPTDNTHYLFNPWADGTPSAWEELTSYTRTDPTSGKVFVWKWWENAINRYDYTAVRNEAAYIRAGYAHHLFQDMTVPAHVFVIRHGAGGFDNLFSGPTDAPTDYYERYVKSYSVSTSGLSLVLPSTLRDHFDNTHHNSGTSGSLSSVFNNYYVSGMAPSGGSPGTAGRYSRDNDGDNAVRESDGKDNDGDGIVDEPREGFDEDRPGDRPGVGIPGRRDDDGDWLDDGVIDPASYPPAGSASPIVMTYKIGVGDGDEDYLGPGPGMHETGIDEDPVWGDNGDLEACGVSSENYISPSDLATMQNILVRDAISYGGGVLKYYHDIVNHPPYLLGAEIKLGGVQRYYRHWEPLVNSANEVYERQLLPDPSTTKHLFSGVDFALDLVFSEPVEPPGTKIVLDNGTTLLSPMTFTAYDAEKKWWHATMNLPPDNILAPQWEGRLATLVVDAEDRNYHWYPSGTILGANLDPNPATPAKRRATITASSEAYRWEGYENASGVADPVSQGSLDRNHSFILDNFRPFAQEVTIGAAYEGEWQSGLSSSGSSVMNFYLKPLIARKKGTGWVGANDEEISIIFSEPMDLSSIIVPIYGTAIEPIVDRCRILDTGEYLWVGDLSREKMCEIGEGEDIPIRLSACRAHLIMAHETEKRG